MPHLPAVSVFLGEQEKHFYTNKYRKSMEQNTKSACILKVETDFCCRSLDASSLALEDSPSLSSARGKCCFSASVGLFSGKGQSPGDTLPSAPVSEPGKLTWPPHSTACQQQSLGVELSLPWGIPSHQGCGFNLTTLCKQLLLFGVTCPGSWNSREVSTVSEAGPILVEERVLFVWGQLCLKCFN